MKEKVHTFGEDDGLLGIVTVPDEPRPGAPFVVLLNAGLVHRVGPFRMHVPLARRLAAEGVHVLRVDQSALGDSAPRKGSLSYEERAVLDARAAVDFAVERYGAERPVLVGLCSGAMNAHRAAVADERVVGACLLDGYAYRTKGFLRRRALARLSDPPAFARSAKLAMRRLAARSGSSAVLRLLGDPGEASQATEEGLPGDDASAIFQQDWPEREGVQRELAGVLGRGARALFIYSGNGSDFDDLSQFDEMFPGLPHRGRVEVALYPEADHTFTLTAHRAMLIDRISRWVGTFGQP